MLKSDITIEDFFSHEGEGDSADIHIVHFYKHSKNPLLTNNENKEAKIMK